MTPGTGLARAFYFFYYAAMAALLPFLVLYYQQLGLSGNQIGLLASIPPTMVLVGSSLWGALADLSQQHKLVLLAAIAGASGMALALGHVGTFAWLVPTVIGFALFMSPIVPLGDNSVLELLGERRSEYGRVRLWGARGWGLSAPVIGRVVQKLGLGWSFRAYAALMLGCLLVAAFLPVARKPLSGPFRQGLMSLWRSPRWRLFLFVVFVGGSGLGFVHHFLFLHMDHLGASRSLMGWALTVSTVSELLVFYWADRWLQRWGVRWLLLAAMVATALRLFAYSVVRAPELVLVIQLLHGPSFALMWSAGVTYANQLAPPGMGATAQGLFSGVNFGLAGGTGALIGGVLYEHWGTAGMYAWAGCGVLVGLLVYGVASRGLTAVEPQEPGSPG